MTTTSAQTLTSETLLATATTSTRGPVLLAAALVAGLVSAMQQMNIAIVNPVFIATFLGAPLLAGAAAVVAGPQARPWAIAATALAVGTLVITFAGNIPLNDALDAAGPVDKIKDLAAVRADFESLWVKLNVARTLTSAAALGCLARAALRVSG